jgi:hypothetical protein
MRARLFSLLFALLALSGCVSITDVTSRHPYRDHLIGEFITTKPFYLYDHGRHGYFVMESPLTSYRLAADGTQTPIESLPDIVLPRKSKVRIIEIGFASTMSSGPHTALLGWAQASGEAPIKIYAFHESLPIDLVRWQEAHGLLSRPSSDDYVRMAQVSTFQW